MRFPKHFRVAASRSGNRPTIAQHCFGVLTGILLVALAGTAILASEAEHGFRAGAAAIDITPNSGVSLDGPISKNGPVQGVHDRLFSRALVLDNGRTKLAIVVNDACIIERSVFDAAKDIAHRDTGIPTANMLACATHSHAAVRAMHIAKGRLDDEYHEFLARQIAAAVIEADQRLAPARIGFGSFDKPELLACRRFLCKPGTVGANPFGGKDEQVKSVAGTSTGVIRPAGPVDPQVSVVSVRHADGTPLAVLANFSVHYCGGYQRGLVSADYFGAFARRLEEQLAVESQHPPPVAMMSNGTSGDAGSISRLGKRYAPFERLEEAGRQLADEALQVITRIDHRAPDRLAVGQSELELAVRLPDEERIAWANSVLSDARFKAPHRWTPIYAREALELSKYAARYKIVLQAFRIGDIGIAAIPCEVFGETGVAIKQQSPITHTFTIELANGYSGYLPTPEQHRLGGYETWPARSSHLEVDAESKIRNEVVRLLGKVSENQ